MFTSNADIYHGKTYGSGKCYLCTQCGAYVGTHFPRPREALGLLANERMRKGKMVCHAIFDSKWKGCRKAHKRRDGMYKWLAGKLGISHDECHFGWFDIDMLIKSYIILEKIKDAEMHFDSNGDVYFWIKGKKF